MVTPIKLFGNTFSNWLTNLVEPITGYQTPATRAKDPVIVLVKQNVPQFKQEQQIDHSNQPSLITRNQNRSTLIHAQNKSQLTTKLIIALEITNRS